MSSLASPNNWAVDGHMSPYHVNEVCLFFLSIDLLKTMLSAAGIVPQLGLFVHCTFSPLALIIIELHICSDQKQPNSNR